MILDTMTKLEAVLAGAISANQPEVHVDYVDWNKSGAMTNPAPFRTQLNGNTDVTILAAPVQNPIREPLRVAIYNKDTASVTLTIKTDDGTTERILIKATLLTLESLNWEKDRGWYAVDANGNLKEIASSIFSSTGITVPTSAIGNAYSSSYTPTASGTTNLDSTPTGNVTGYMRVGNQVTVAGTISVDPTATGAVIFRLSLPVTSNLGAASDLGGAGACETNAVSIYGSAANDNAEFSYTATGTAAQVVCFTFSYRII